MTDRERMPRSARPPDRALWVDGRIRRGDQAVVSLFDRGARDGEGLFETLRVYDGRPFLWERHLERLVLAAAELGFPVPPAPVTLEHALFEVLEAERLSNAVVRITVTRGIPGRRPTRVGCWVEAEPIGARLWHEGHGRDLAAIFSKRPFQPGSLGGFKTTSRLPYQLARDEARARGAHEALLVSPQGEVLEGAVSNVFAVVRGEVLTPPLEAGILPGITRAWVLTTASGLGLTVSERPIARAELEAAVEVFLTNSVQEVVPLGRLEENPLPERAIGEKLLGAYRAAVTAG